MIVRLEDAREEGAYGGKAVQLGTSLRAGLPVPGGLAIDVESVDAVVRGHRDAVDAARAAFEGLGRGRIAVRSSAVGEDGGDASFAGQHVTRLGVATPEAMLEAIAAVFESARSAAARAYRARMKIAGEPRIAVVLQRMIDPVCAGVLFTRHPVTAEDERLIEACWGLGEAVVSGLVDPDRVRLARDGAVLEHTVGEKTVAVRMTDDGTAEVEVEEHLQNVPCLDEARLSALGALAARCEATWDGAHDIEWAFAEERVWLLQRRAITR